MIHFHAHWKFLFSSAVPLLLHSVNQAMQYVNQAMKSVNQAMQYVNQAM